MLLCSLKFYANAVSVAIGDNGNRLIFKIPQLINWKHNFKIIMDAVEDYARRWKKREVDQDRELESLSDWVRTTNTILLETLSAGTITYLS
jgi:hypothetical protein